MIINTIIIINPPNSLYYKSATGEYKDTIFYTDVRKEVR